MKRNEQTQVFISKSEKDQFLTLQRRVSVILGMSLAQHELLALMNRVMLSCTDEFIRQVYDTYFNR